MLHLTFSISFLCFSWLYLISLSFSSNFSSMIFSSSNISSIIFSSSFIASSSSILGIGSSSPSSSGPNSTLNSLSEPKEAGLVGDISSLSLAKVSSSLISFSASTIVSSSAFSLFTPFSSCLSKVTEAGLVEDISSLSLAKAIWPAARPRLRASVWAGVSLIMRMGLLLVPVMPDTGFVLDQGMPDLKALVLRLTSLVKRGPGKLLMVADGEKVFTLDTVRTLAGLCTLLLVDIRSLISALGAVSKLGTEGILMTEYG